MYGIGNPPVLDCPRCGTRTSNPADVLTSYCSHCDTFLLEPVGLNCPLCGERAFAVLGGGAQAFCGNDACRVLMWPPKAGWAQYLAQPATWVDLRPPGPPAAPPAGSPAEPG